MQIEELKKIVQELLDTFKEAGKIALMNNKSFAEVAMELAAEGAGNKREAHRRRVCWWQCAGRCLCPPHHFGK